MKRVSFLLAAVAATLLLNGCLGGAFDLGSTAMPPTDLKAVAGDSSVTLTWTMSPKVEYWVFTAPGTSVTTDNWLNIGGHAYPKVESPYVVPYLPNGTTYAFTVNGRMDGGSGGPGSAVVTATPRLAGETWTAGTALGSGNLNAVTFGSAFVAVGAQGALYSSPDFNSWTPITWTALKNPMTDTRPDLNAATYGNGVYLAAGAGGTMLRSSNAVTWTQQATSTNGNDIYALATNGSTGFVAVGQNGTILTSADGITWTTVSSGTTNDLHAVTYGHPYWIAAGKNGTALISVNGANWTPLATNTTQNIKGITYGISINPTTAVQTGMFVAVGDNGTLLTSIDNGTTWTNGKINNGATSLSAVTFGRQFIAVGDSGGIFTSTDGATWKPQTSGTTGKLIGIGHSAANYSVVGAGGTNLSSI